MTDHPWMEIANRALRARICPVGAELVGLQDGEGTEWMWTGDTASFAHSSPLLFPVVGRLAQGSTLARKTLAPMPMHGIALNATFSLVSRSATDCTFVWAARSGEIPCFPAAFCLKVDYALSERCLTQTVTVTNREVRHAFLFNLGFHPAFTVAWSAGQPCKIRFPRDESLTMYLGRNAFRSETCSTLELQGHYLDLTADTLKRGALMFGDLRSRSLTVALPGRRRSLTLGFSNLNCLALWRHPGAEFLCLEPWLHLPRARTECVSFEKPEGFSLLGPRETRRYSMCICVSMD